MYLFLFLIYIIPGEKKKSNKAVEEKNQLRIKQRMKNQIVLFVCFFFDCIFYSNQSTSKKNFFFCCCFSYLLFPFIFQFCKVKDEGKKKKKGQKIENKLNN